MKKYVLIIFTLVYSSNAEILGQNMGNLKSQKPISISGSLSTSLQFYGAKGIQNRRQPFTWYLTGSPTVKLYGLTMPFSLTVSEQNRNFSQPFNRYGTSPYFKWIKLHLGYRNVRFSDFTLGGANFLGGGVELTPRNLRLGFVYGQFAKRIFEDSTANDPRYKYLRPTYQRLGMAAKVGFGKPQSFVDFCVFKASDVVESIYKPSKRARLTPMENLAASVKSRLSFFKNKLNFDFEVGASLLTRDITKKDIVVTEPWHDKMLKIMAINSSSGLYTAAKASTSYGFKKGGIRLDFQHIDPDYQSLGAYFFQNDVEQITLSPNFSLLKGKLNIGGSYGRSHDNLKNKKALTTSREVAALNIGLSVIKNLNLNLSYSNFGLGQSRGIGDLFNDSLAISVVNASYTGNLNYSFGAKSKKQSVGMVAVYQNTSDLSQFSRQYSVSNSFIYNAIYSLNIPKKINASTSLSYVLIEAGGKKMLNIGPNLNASKEWMKGLLRSTVNHNSQIRNTNGLADGLTSNSSLNLAINRKKQSISIASSYLFNTYISQADGTNYRNFSEYRGTITYGIRF